MRFVFSILGLGLGGVFVYAGVQKHLAPYEFAEAILAYQLLPLGLVGLVAATLPWLEMVSGFSLTLGYLWRGRRFSNPVPMGGLLRRSALLLILGQSLLFVAVLLITLARGLKIDCGCGLFMDRQVGLEPSWKTPCFWGWLGWLYWQAEQRLEGDQTTSEPGGSTRKINNNLLAQMRFQAQILLLLYALDKLFEQFQGFLAVFIYHGALHPDKFAFSYGHYPIFFPMEGPRLSILD